MKKIAEFTFVDNQSSGEIEVSVSRGHASVRISFEDENGKSTDVWLNRHNAIELSEAIRTAATQLEGPKPSPSFGLLG